MNEKPSFFAELKRRNVYKVAVAYGVVAWLLMQIASQIFPFFAIPNWVVRLVILLLVIGFPIALIIAWAFEATGFAYQIAQVYAVRGDADKGFEWLQISFDDHDGGTLGLSVDPLLRSLRDDPRYKSLLGKLGLPATS